MTEGRTISIEGLERAVAIAHCVNRKISAWLTWEKMPARHRGDPPPYEAAIRYDLLRLTETIDEAVAGCERCQGARKVWDCPLHPGCDCPGGTTVPGCPGETIPCPKCSDKRADHGN